MKPCAFSSLIPRIRRIARITGKHWKSDFINLVLSSEDQSNCWIRRINLVSAEKVTISVFKKHLQTIVSVYAVKNGTADFTILCYKVPHFSHLLKFTVLNSEHLMAYDNCICSLSLRNFIIALKLREHISNPNKW